MNKRIAALSADPYTVSLIDRNCSLFIDPQSGSIFVDEGEGNDRINGVVFSAANEPSFVVESAAQSEYQLILDYCGVQYFIGVMDHAEQLRSWASSANVLLGGFKSAVASRERSRIGTPHLAGLSPEASGGVRN